MPIPVEAAPKGQILPGTSQAKGPPGQAALEAGTTEGEGFMSPYRLVRSLPMSDTSFANRHIGPSPEEVVDLLQGGQGVFGIAIGGAFKEIKGSLEHLPAERAQGEPAQPLDAEEPVPGEEGRDLVADELAARRARRRAG